MVFHNVMLPDNFCEKDPTACVYRDVFEEHESDNTVRNIGANCISCTSMIQQGKEILGVEVDCGLALMAVMELHRSKSAKQELRSVSHA